ncbi:unnamed protein product [Rhizophagus irregularis]|nr:unnamed protein product [Rhizophagus irregularis]
MVRNHLTQNNVASRQILAQSLQSLLDLSMRDNLQWYSDPGNKRIIHPRASSNRALMCSWLCYWLKSVKWVGQTCYYYHQL